MYMLSLPERSGTPYFRQMSRSAQLALTSCAALNLPSGLLTASNWTLGQQKLSTPPIWSGSAAHGHNPADRLVDGARRHVVGVDFGIGGIDGLADGQAPCPIPAPAAARRRRCSRRAVFPPEA